MFVNRNKLGFNKKGKGGKPVFHLTPEIAWYWLELSGKPGGGFSNYRKFILSDPAWVVWALQHTRAIPPKKGFFDQLLRSESKSVRQDFASRVVDPQSRGDFPKLFRQHRIHLANLGRISRKWVRLLPELDADFFNLCSTMVALPALLDEGSKKTDIGSLVSAWGYPLWARQLTEAFYSGIPGKAWCKTRKRIWHTLRMVFGTATDLPKKLPRIAGKELEQSCSFLGVESGKIRKYPAPKAEVATFSAASRRSRPGGWGHLKIALGLWVSQTPRGAKNKGPSLPKKSAPPSGESSALEPLGGDGLEKVRSEIIAELAGGAGHEINNPLAILLGRAQSLITEQAVFLKEEKREEGVRRLASIAEHGKRIHVMIRKLARIGRPAPGRPVPVCLKEELEKWLAPWREKAVRQGIVFAWAWSEIPRNFPEVFVDPAYMKEALDELLDNAFVQVSEGGRIEVGITREKASCLVDVSNNGPSITPEVSRLLFHPFYSNRKAGRFSGLGLPLAKSLLEASGGKLILQSLGDHQPVCFRIQVPLLTGSSVIQKTEPIDGAKAA